jgi:hypothetical protein
MDVLLSFALHAEAIPFLPLFVSVLLEEPRQPMLLSFQNFAFRHLAELLGRRVGRRKASTYTGQHITERRGDTHASSETQTYNPCNRSHRPKP